MEEKNKYFNEGEVPFEQQDIPKGEEKEPNMEEPQEEMEEENLTEEAMEDELDEEMLDEEMLDEEIADYDNAFEYWKSRVEESPFGKIGGIMAGIVAVVTHVIGTAVRNLLFNGREQLEIKKAFDDSLGAKDLKQERKRQNEKEDAKTEEKEETIHDKDRATNHDIDNRTEYQRAIDEQLESYQVDQRPESIPEEWLTQHDEVSRDECAQIMANDENVRRMFNAAGCILEADPNSENLYISRLQNGKSDNTSYLMPKEDLLNGNATSFGSILNQYRSNDLYVLYPKDAEKRDKELERVKYETTIEAVLSVGGARAYSNMQDMEDAKHDGIEMPLSQMNVIGPCGAFKLEMVSSLEPEKDIDIHYNNVKIQSMKLEDLKSHENILPEIYANIHAINEHAADRVFPTKDKVNVEKTEDGFHVTANKAYALGKEGDGISESIDLGTYNFNNTIDTWALSKALEENQIMCCYTGDKPDYQVFAYSLGLITNPDLMAIEDEKGRSLNLFTGEPEQKGNAHIYTQPTPYGVNMYMMIPKPDGTSEQVQAGFGFHDNINLTPKNLQAIYEGMEYAKQHILEPNKNVDKEYNRYGELRGHGNDRYLMFPTAGNDEIAAALKKERDVSDFLEGKEPEKFLSEEEKERLYAQKPNIELPNEIIYTNAQNDERETAHIIREGDSILLADEEEYNEYLKMKNSEGQKDKTEDICKEDEEILCEESKDEEMEI